MRVLFSTWLLGIIFVSSGVEGDCDFELGMKRKLIPDKDITASSSLNENNTPAFARLDGPGAWCSAPTDNSPYLQIMLGGEKSITAIITQGSRLQSRWVTEYQIKYSQEGKGFIEVKTDDGKPKIFKGNIASRSLQKNALSIRTRAIRIYPRASRAATEDSALKNVACLRLELYGCGAPVDGGWGEWGDWSECSLTCGLGMRSRERKCDSPKPQNGGRPCNEKERVENKFCRERKCKGTEHYAGYSGSGYGWETYSGDGNGVSGSEPGGWEEHSALGPWAEGDDEDY